MSPPPKFLGSSATRVKSRMETRLSKPSTCRLRTVADVRPREGFSRSFSRELSNTCFMRNRMALPS